MAKRPPNKKKTRNRVSNGIKTAKPKNIIFSRAGQVAIILLLLTGSAYIFFKNASFFRIEKIEIIDRKNAGGVNSQALLKLYKGRNIFDVDIRALSNRIKSDYPAIRDVVVKRILPNKLQINVTARIPVAKIKSREYYPVDRSGMVLSPNIKTGNLPILIGFSMWFRPRVGEVVDNPQISNAFLLIDDLDKSSFSSKYNVTAIDVSNYANMLLYLENGIEIKIGGEDFLNRLKMLKDTLSNPNLDKENIKYIDLRFKNVVIGPK